MYLNTKNQLIARKTLFVDGFNSSIVHPHGVFREALKLSAAHFMPVHNYPSGDATPSREDIEVSERWSKQGTSSASPILVWLCSLSMNSTNLAFGRCSSACFLCTSGSTYL